ncbi:MAG TPA: gluconokinase [Casimicrobiaceae bacterium]|jgi:carbohydrate kinase (thermoresistant glucokinase family)|nr:gluconokinase [Casimicrobiaceae bacterium]
MTVLLMGVSGSGKSTVGPALAAELNWPFLDADTLHPQANVAKMASGIPLTDADRWPWFDRIVAEMRRYAAAGKNVVIACSALKQAYRDRLASGGSVRVVYLKGDAETIAPRLAGRRGHFMPPSLLASQFATLEEPDNAIVVDITQPVAAQVAAITRALREQLPA